MSCGQAQHKSSKWFVGLPHVPVLWCLKTGQKQEQESDSQVLNILPGLGILNLSVWSGLVLSCLVCLVVFSGLSACVPLYSYLYLYCTPSTIIYDGPRCSGSSGQILNEP